MEESVKNLEHSDTAPMRGWRGFARLQLLMRRLPLDWILSRSHMEDLGASSLMRAVLYDRRDFGLINF